MKEKDDKRGSVFKNADVRWDEARILPRKVRGLIRVQQKETPEETVRAFFAENLNVFKLEPDKENLRLIRESESPLGKHLRFQQHIKGVPVFGGEVLVRFDRDGNIRNMKANHELATRIIPVRRRKRISEEDAEKVARKAIREPIKLRPNGRVEVETYYFPTKEGLRLSHCVTIPTQEPVHDWRVFVDAYTREILSIEDIVWRSPVDGQGMVFDPNPVVTANDNTFRDGVTPDATLNAERFNQTLSELNDALGGQYSLIGPFCRITNLGAPSTGIPQEANANDFDYNRGDIDFEAVNVYYHIDSIQRYIQDVLGITNANNRQTDADPHDHSHEYAWYSSLTKDLHFGDSGAGRPDRAEDGDCMAHEYGHAIQDNMVPNWGEAVLGTTRYESRAMGEAFCDVLAALFFVTAGGGYQRQVVEDWVFADRDLGGGLRGMRRVDRATTYSSFLVGSGNHYANSEIWSGSLWDIFLSIGGISATPADWVDPRDELLKAVITSYNNLTSRASMPEAAEEVMNSHVDLDDQRGVHAIEMLDVFHDREVLECTAGSDVRLTRLWPQQDNLNERSWEQVEYGQDNYFYAEINNQGGGAARAVMVTFSFKTPFSTPVYPTDFRDNIISAAVEYDLLPGESRVVHARWPSELIPPVPAGEDRLHGCIFAEVYNPVDHVPAGATTIGASNGKLRYCNTDIVDLEADEDADYVFSIGNRNIARWELIRLEVIRPKRWPEMEVAFHHYDRRVVEGMLRSVVELELMRPARIEEAALAGPQIRFLHPAKISLDTEEGEPDIILDLARGSSMTVPRKAIKEGLAMPLLGDEFLRSDVDVVMRREEAYLRVRPGEKAGFPYVMMPRKQLTMGVKIRAPRDSRPGDKIKVEFIQRNKKGELVGGFDVLINVVEQRKPRSPKVKRSRFMKRL